MLLDRNDVFVSGDLKHAVRRRVDDWFSGTHVLGTETVDDLRAGRHDVAECPASDPPLEFSDDVRREPMGKRRKGPIQDDAHHLPVTRHRVLAGRRFRHPSVGAKPWTPGRRAVTHPRDTIEAQRAQTRNRERHLFRDVPERVAARVAVRSGVRKLAATHAVEDDQNDA